MITLAVDCLVFTLATGESVPFSSDMVSVELMGSTAQRFDEDFVKDAAKAVFHFFKHEQGRSTISVAEFAEALEQVLGGFGSPAPTAPASSGGETLRAPGSDLGRLARESSHGCELFFFAQLRTELRRQVQENPGVVRFSGLRDCVKQLLRARRWGARCRTLEEQIVRYLNECLSAESRSGNCSLLVK